MKATTGFHIRHGPSCCFVDSRRAPRGAWGARRAWRVLLLAVCCTPAAAPNATPAWSAQHQATRALHVARLQEARCILPMALSTLARTCSTARPGGKAQIARAALHRSGECSFLPRPELACCGHVPSSVEAVLAPPACLLTFNSFLLPFRHSPSAALRFPQADCTACPVLSTGRRAHACAHRQHPLQRSHKGDLLQLRQGKKVLRPRPSPGPRQSLLGAKAPPAACGTPAKTSWRRRWSPRT